MQITPLTKNSFKGTPLFPVNIKTKQLDGSFKKIPAHFVELDCFDNRDCDLMLKIYKRWISKEYLSNYASSICKNFFQGHPSDRRFFTIQLDNFKSDAYSNIVAIMETSNPENNFKNYLEINFLQSATSIVPGFSPVKAKGAGEQLIYGAIKLAQKHDLDNIVVLSTNDNFYEKIGFEHQYDDDIYYKVPRKNFDKFAKQIEEKYK